jgi:hypothetical protein
LVDAVEVAFESVDVSGPEATKGSEPGVDLLKWFRFEPVETALCVDGGFDETGVAQDAQVLGDGRLRHPKLTLDVAHGVLRGDEEAQYGAAVRLGNDFED